MWIRFMPTTSTTAPPMKTATQKPQKAGLKTMPSCSLVMWKARISGSPMSPRILKATEVVSRDTQLAANSFCLFIGTS
jgi:hypothetical protein